MAVFQCKMCGAPLEVEEKKTTTTCPYCNMVQTLPRITSEKKQELYERAGRLRLQNEYDNAITIYEQILCEDSFDSEAYWGIVLCRYGIEYVEDPKSKKRIPTINRLQFNSILEDEDYQKALENADSFQKDIYIEEGKTIDEIQKGILQISNSEKPFDVFISYKETDQNGRRTLDSVLANDLYYQLTEAGFKVFYSRITLEDKLGTAYEPYIFAALNSAKVMVVIGTKTEYFNAVWVKNEWNRYLSLIKKGQKKVLIPAYKDMDPYDLPTEFANLQAQDMSKLGFMQDLIRGIKKLIGEEKKTTEVKENNPSVTSLLKRAYLFLEDADHKSAEEYANKVLDINPECGEAYYIKFMCDYHIKLKDNKLYYNVDQFINVRVSNIIIQINQNPNYQKAVRFNFSNIKELEKAINNSIINKLIAISKNDQLNIDDLISVYHFFKKNNIRTNDLEDRLYKKADNSSDHVVFSKLFSLLKSNERYSKKICVSAYKHLKATNFNNKAYYSLIKDYQDFNEKIFLELQNSLESNEDNITFTIYWLVNRILEENEKKLIKIYDSLDSSQSTAIETICDIIKKGKLNNTQELKKAFQNLTSSKKDVLEASCEFLRYYIKYKNINEKISDKAIECLENGEYNRFKILYSLIGNNRDFNKTHKQYPKLSKKIYEMFIKYLENDETDISNELFCIIKNDPIFLEEVINKACIYLENNQYSLFECLYKKIESFNINSIRLSFIKQLMLIKNETEELSKKNYSHITNLFKALYGYEYLINSTPIYYINTKEIIYNLAKNSYNPKYGYNFTYIELLGYLKDYKDSKSLRRKEIMKLQKRNIIFFGVVLAEIILLTILTIRFFGGSNIISQISSEPMIVLNVAFYLLVAIVVLRLFNKYLLKVRLVLLKIKFHKFK